MSEIIYTIPFKTINNKLSTQTFVNIDIGKLFYSEGNKLLLANHLFIIHQQNGGRSTLTKFQSLTPRLMKEFNKTKDIYEYSMAECQANKMQNWSAILKQINADFTKFCYKFFKWNRFVPTREYALVGPSDKRVYKRFQDLRPEDYGTLDFWREQQIQITNAKQRDNNQIPHYRATIHVRNYDRSNEGFAETKERTSLENFQRSLDTKTVFDIIDNYHSEGWFGM